MDKKLVPNSTQVPNILFDFIIPNISEAEVKCLLYICRRTYGFHKERDRISLSQFVDGIKTKDGKILDTGAGISRPSAIEALKNLTGAGLLEIIRTGKGNYYKINLDLNIENTSENEVVKKVNQLRKLTKSGKESKPKQVNLLNLQKKGNIEKQSYTSNGQAVARENNLDINPLIDLFKTVNPSYERLFTNNTQRQATLRLLNKLGKEKLEQIIAALEKTNKVPFAPTITTPLQLEEKIGNLIAFIQKERLKLPQIININSDGEIN